MRTNRPKFHHVRPRLVAVIASRDDVQRALRLRNLPEFFELRLDALYGSRNELLKAAPDLRAPLIVTARHPKEGGCGRLNARQRRRVLMDFLPLAALVDVELRSVSELEAVLTAARDANVLRIISVHDLQSLPTATELDRFADAARNAGADIFKLAARTRNARELQRLTDFFRRTRSLMPLSVMPVGKAARASRLLFAREGSALNYTHLGEASAEGQWSFAELRRALRARD